MTQTHKVSEIEVKDVDGLHDAIKQIRQHFSTLQYNDRSMIVEIWRGDIIDEDEFLASIRRASTS